MAMSSTIMAASALSAVTMGLLGVLLAVWVRNYRTFGSPLILGLIAFGGVLLVENGLAIYFFFQTTMLYAGVPAAQQAILALRALQLVAVLFLTAVSMQ
ncbi:MAG: hypothetical protein ABEJ08_02530 [Halobacteriaceae archaeon]